MTEKDEILVQRYLEGDLTETERSSLESRMEREGELRQLLEWYGRLDCNLASLDDEEPTPDLWQRRLYPALKAGVGAGFDVSWSRIAGWLNNLVFKPGIVIAGFVAVIFAVTFFIRNNVIEEPADRVDQVVAEIQDLRRQMLERIEVLKGDVDGRLEQLARETPSVYTDLHKAYNDTLSKIDESIADAERLFNLFPRDPEAIQMLLAAYDRKLNVILDFKNEFL